MDGAKFRLISVMLLSRHAPTRMSDRVMTLRNLFGRCASRTSAGTFDRLKIFRGFPQLLQAYARASL